MEKMLHPVKYILINSKTNENHKIENLFWTGFRKAAPATQKTNE